MSNVNVIYQKIHFRHDPRWSAITGPTAGDVVLCVACVIEMMESKDVSVSINSNVSYWSNCKLFVLLVLKYCPYSVYESQWHWQESEEC